MYIRHLVPLMRTRARNRKMKVYRLISWFPIGLIPEAVQGVHEGEKQGINEPDRGGESHLFFHVLV